MFDLFFPSSNLIAGRIFVIVFNVPLGSHCQEVPDDKRLDSTSSVNRLEMEKKETERRKQRESTCVCVCVREREKERERERKSDRERERKGEKE